QRPRLYGRRRLASNPDAAIAAAEQARGFLLALWPSIGSHRGYRTESLCRKTAAIHAHGRAAGRPARSSTVLSGKDRPGAGAGDADKPDRILPSLGPP